MRGNFSNHISDKSLCVPDPAWGGGCLCPAEDCPQETGYTKELDWVTRHIKNKGDDVGGVRSREKKNKGIHNVYQIETRKTGVSSQVFKICS